MANDKTLRVKNMLHRVVEKGRMHFTITDIDVDVKSDLVDFKECLLAALSIIDQELIKFKK